MAAEDWLLMVTRLLPFFSWQLHGNQAPPLLLMANSWQRGSTYFSHDNLMATRLLPFFSWQLHCNQAPPFFLMAIDGNQAYPLFSRQLHGNLAPPLLLFTNLTYLGY